MWSTPFLCKKVDGPRLSIKVWHPLFQHSRSSQDCWNNARETTYSHDAIRRIPQRSSCKVDASRREERGEPRDILANVGHADIGVRPGFTTNPVTANSAALMFFTRKSPLSTFRTGSGAPGGIQLCAVHHLNASTWPSARKQLTTRDRKSVV